jgi:hypothetical protein
MMIDRMRCSTRTARLLGLATAFAAGWSGPIAASAAPQGRGAPAAAQARCPAPSSWGASRTAGSADRPVNLIQLDRAGTLYWNGVRIKETMLRQYMILVGAMTPRPRTHLEVDPAAQCAGVARIAAMIAGAVDCRRTCQYRVAPWRPASPVSPPVPPAPPRRIR